MLYLFQSIFSSPHMKCPPFLIKSYIRFNSFCNSGQNMLKKFTIPVKLLHPFGVVGRCNFCIASNLFLHNLTQTFLSFINIMFPMYCNSVLNAFKKFSNFAICAFFEGVKNSILPINALQCFLLCKHLNIAFMYDCQIEGEMFNPIGILWYKYQALPKYGNVPQYLF